MDMQALMQMISQMMGGRMGGGMDRGLGGGMGMRRPPPMADNSMGLRRPPPLFDDNNAPPDAFSRSLGRGPEGQMGQAGAMPMRGNDMNGSGSLTGQPNFFSSVMRDLGSPGENTAPGVDGSTPGFWQGQPGTSPTIPPDTRTTVYPPWTPPGQGVEGLRQRPGMMGRQGRMGPVSLAQLAQLR